MTDNNGLKVRLVVMDTNNVLMLQTLHITQTSKYQQHKFEREYINQLGNRSVEGG
jgi:hypothetical protein